MQQRQETEEEHNSPAPSFLHAPLPTAEKQTEARVETSDSHAWTQGTINKLYRQTRQCKLARIVSGLSYCVFGLLMLTFSSMGHSVLAITNIIFPLTAIFVFRALAKRQDAKVRNLLAQIEDKRFVGPLAEIVATEQVGKNPVIVAALCRLLPRVQASDALLLTKNQRACLYAILKRRRWSNRIYDKSLQMAILKALEQIGDKEALPAVQRLANWSSDKEVRHAANNCLPYLLERSEAYKRGAMYLRPADARTSAPDVLLRASTGITPQQQTPPEQLLRTHEPE